MRRPCCLLGVSGFRVRRSLRREQKGAPRLRTKGPSPSEKSAHRPQAISTLRPSIQFAAALCEISGGFLIFPARGQEPHTNGRSLSFGSVAPEPPFPPSTPCLGSRQPPYIHIKVERFAVTAREGRVFRRRRDRSHAD
jgi:hypothetical protein